MNDDINTETDNKNDSINDNCAHKNKTVSEDNNTKKENDKSTNNEKIDINLVNKAKKIFIDFFNRLKKHKEDGFAKLVTKAVKSLVDRFNRFKARKEENEKKQKLFNHWWEIPIVIVFLLWCIPFNYVSCGNQLEDAFERGLEARLSYIGAVNDSVIEMIDSAKYLAPEVIQATYSSIKEGVNKGYITLSNKSEEKRGKTKICRAYVEITDEGMKKVTSLFKLSDDGGAWKDFYDLYIKRLMKEVLSNLKGNTTFVIKEQRDGYAISPLDWDEEVRQVTRNIFF